MISLKYNEEKYALKLLEKGFLTKYHTYELKILIKYYKYLGFKPKERKKLIYDFCKKHIENFNRVKYFKQINSVLRYGSKKTSKLIIIDKIPITDKEIEYINSLDIDYNFKKVLFSLLVQNKINKEITNIIYGKSSNFNFFGGKNQYYKEIYEMSKIPAAYKINSVINYLSDNGLVDVRTRGRINLLFINNIDNSDNVIMNITTYDNVGYYLDWYNSDSKIIECEKCGKFIKMTSNRRKYCKDCWNEVREEQNRENFKNWYNKQKI